MGEKHYHRTPEGGIAFGSTRKPGEVRISNFVYDLWLPLVGAEAIGVYGLYCRLERNEGVRNITLRDLARACRVGDKRLNDINDILMACGFITVNKPAGAKRLMHWKTEIVVHDPPTKISAAIIAEYEHPQGYTPVSTWLVAPNNDSPETPSSDPGNTNERSAETLPSVSGDTNQCVRNPLDRDSMIETLDLVEPLESPPPMSPVIAAIASGGGGEEETETECFLRETVGAKSAKARQALADLPLAAVQQRWAQWQRDNPKGGPGAFIDDLKASPPGPDEPEPPPIERPVAPYERPNWNELSYDEQAAAHRAYDRQRVAWRQQHGGQA